jgi:hypothetical protein
MYLSHHVKVARRAKFRPMVLQIVVPLHIILNHSMLKGINHAPKVRKTLIKIWRDEGFDPRNKCCQNLDLNFLHLILSHRHQRYKASIMLQKSSGP